jgi:hypothetical protein
MNQLLSTGIQPVGHRRQPSGVKRPSAQDHQDDRDHKVKETVKDSMRKDATVEATGMKERKRRKVSTTALDDPKILVSHMNIHFHSDTHARQPCNLFFSPVGSIDIRYNWCTDVEQPCSHCAAAKQLCAVRMTTDGRKIKPCGSCGIQKTGCDAFQELFAVVDGNGNVIHSRGSWGNLASQHKARDVGERVEAKAKVGKVATMAKYKGKDRASEPEQEEGQWASEPNPGLTPAMQLDRKVSVSRVSRS